ncbi:MAG: hypothetical protein WC701_14700, partial [Kiritimatiellales bacterium]
RACHADGGWKYHQSGFGALGRPGKEKSIFRIQRGSGCGGENRIACERENGKTNRESQDWKRKVCEDRRGCSAAGKNN